MAFIILEPALVALLLASATASTPAASTAAITPARGSPCNAGVAASAGFDCCLHLPAWSAITATPLNHSAQSREGADPQEGR